MEVLAILVLLVVCIACISFGVVILGFVLLFLWMLWPALLGIVGGIFLWRAGHDNIAVVVIFLSFALQKYWFERTGGSDTSSSFDPREWIGGIGKRKRYDAKGKVIGYEDK